jgi:hypothetical protein
VELEYLPSVQMLHANALAATEYFPVAQLLH